MPDAHWRDASEAGSFLGIRFMLLVAKYLGRGFLHQAVAPLALYFLLTRATERKASREFLTRVTGKPPSWHQQFRHFLTFSRVIADRYFLILGQTEDIPMEAYGVAELQKLVDEQRGGIALGAHFGSFEVARILADRLSGATLRMVLDKKISANLLQGLEMAQPDIADAVIDLGQSSAGLALEISDSLQRGEWVGFMADRDSDDSRSESFEFLGDDVNFPLGPVIIAGIFNVPLISVFPVYADGGYKLYCQVIGERVELPRGARDEAIRQYVGRYVAGLEERVKASPYNWFNYFDFWKAL